MPFMTALDAPQASSDNSPQLPLMNPFPLPQSVILIDNCAIHKLEIVQGAVEAKGQSDGCHLFGFNITTKKQNRM